MAVDMFLVLSNGIKGETADEVYNAQGGIDIQSWSWGLSQSGTSHAGTGSGSGKVNVNDIHLSKYVDLSTHDLIKRCCSGTHFEFAELFVRKAGGDTGPVVYFRIKMEQVIVSSYSTGGAPDGTDKIMESLSLNFRKFTVGYTPQSAEGGAEAAETTVTWDIAKNVGENMA